MLSLEVNGPVALLALSKRTADRFGRVVRIASDVSLSRIDTPHSYFSLGMWPSACHLAGDDRVTLIYNDGRQRWMCDIRHPEGTVNLLAPDLNDPVAAREAALLASLRIAYICQLAVEAACGGSAEADARQTRARLNALGAISRAENDTAASHLRVYAASPWSSLALREARGGRWHHRPVDQAALTSEGISVSASRAHGWVHLSVGPMTVLYGPELATIDKTDPDARALGAVRP